MGPWVAKGISGVPFKGPYEGTMYLPSKGLLVAAQFSGTSGLFALASVSQILNPKTGGLII